MDDFESMLAQGHEAVDAGDLVKASSLYQHCIEKAPSGSDVWKTALIRQASLLMEMEEYQKSIETVRPLLERCPNSRIIYGLIGLCHLELRNYDEAEDALRKSIAIKPRPEHLVFLFRVLSETDRDDEAMLCLQQALEIDPEYEEAHYNLGCCYKRQKEYDLAEHYFRRAVEIDPQYARACAELGWVIYARALKLQRQIECEGGDLKEVRRPFKEARRFLEKTVSLDSNYVWGHVYLGSLLDHMNYETEAGWHYQDALRLWPNCSTTHWLYGDFLSRCGDHAQAGQLLKHAVEIANKEKGDGGGESHFYLGKHYQRCKRVYKAQEAFREAVRRGHKKAQKLLNDISPVT